MFMCTAEAPEKPAPDSLIVCIISAASVMPSPAPPYSCGIAMPSQPASAIARWKSSGKTAAAIALQPVLRIESLRTVSRRVADGELLGGEGEVH